jgi:hypothetical protein
MSSAWWCRLFAMAAISSSYSSYSSTKFWCLSFYINNNRLSNNQPIHKRPLIDLWHSGPQLAAWGTGQLPPKLKSSKLKSGNTSIRFRPLV